MPHLQIALALSLIFCSCLRTLAGEPVQVAGRSLAEWAGELQSENEFVRLRAAKTLGAFGTAAIDILTEALDDPSAGVQYWAASGLGDIGPRAASARKQILKLKDSKSVGLQISAAYALCRFGDVDEGLPILTAALKHPERGVANSAADFLARIGPPARAAVPDLEAAVQHKDYHIRGAALEALRRINETEPSEPTPSSGN